FVVHQLMRRRLPDVEHRRAREMPGRDFLTHRRPPGARPRRAAAVRGARRRRAAPPPATPSTAARAASTRAVRVAATPVAPVIGLAWSAVWTVGAVPSTAAVSVSSRASASRAVSATAGTAVTRIAVLIGGVVPRLADGRRAATRPLADPSAAYLVGARRLALARPAPGRRGPPPSVTDARPAASRSHVPTPDPETTIFLLTRCMPVS